MVAIVLLAVVSALMFIWGDAWGREAQKRNQVEQDIINFEARAKAAKADLTNLFTPSPLMLFIIVLCLAVAFCSGGHESFFYGGRHR